MCLIYPSLPACLKQKSCADAGEYKWFTVLCTRVALCARLTSSSSAPIGSEFSFLLKAGQHPFTLCEINGSFVVFLVFFCREIFTSGEI